MTLFFYYFRFCRITIPDSRPSAYSLFGPNQTKDVGQMPEYYVIRQKLVLQSIIVSLNHLFYFIYCAHCSRHQFTHSRKLNPNTFLRFI